MENLGYYNGEIGLIDEIKVSINDRGCYFGDGVYEASCGKNHIPFLLDEHIDRCYRSAKMLDIAIAMSKAEMKSLLLELVRMVDSPDILLYWQLTRGTGARTHAYSSIKTGPNLWVTVKPAFMKDMYKTYKLITMPDIRFAMCHIKTLNLLPNIMASQQAEQAGCDEAVFHREGIVTECSHSNIHIIENGVLRTAPLSNLILPGITRAALLKIAGEQGIQIRETAFTINEMIDADEVIYTSASAPFSVVSDIDGKPVGGKASGILNVLRHAFLEKMNLAFELK